MNIQFENLNYKVPIKRFFKKTEVKEILKAVDGDFRAFELTAIIGPSGSGKTSLLNILSGYTNNNFTGLIKVNGELKDEKIFRKKSAFIMQESSLHNFLTVREAIEFSMNLKVGNQLNKTKKCKKVQTILESLSLNDVVNVYIKELSGGEQKRLSIAIELVDDPQIMFFDEPTTGLDSSSSTQCLSLMKKLAQSGKTIICTIHQPSALLFEMFDHLYALSDGMCIYQGSSKNLVPFLAELDLICPESYSPCDYLLEIATNDYGPQNDRLADNIKNGKNDQFRNDSNYVIEKDLQLSKESFSEYPSSFLQQFYHLLVRNLLITRRDKTLSALRLFINLIVGLCFGIMYFGIGNDASNIFNIQRYVVYSIYHPMFIGFNSQLTTFSLERPIVKRERFNRHYSTRAYYLALTVVDIPTSIAGNIIFISITYAMTNQPMELFRFSAFFLVTTLVSFTSQGLGLLTGSMVNVKNTMILGCGMLFIFILFSGFFVIMKDTASQWHWLFYGSFLKHGIDGGFLAIFGFNRGKMDCDSVYCHYRWPHKFLESLGIDSSFSNAVIVIITSLFLFRIAAYYIISHRLRH